MSSDAKANTKSEVDSSTPKGRESPIDPKSSDPTNNRSTNCKEDMKCVDTTCRRHHSTHSGISPQAKCQFKPCKNWKCVYYHEGTSDGSSPCHKKNRGDWKDQKEPKDQKDQKGTKKNTKAKAKDIMLGADATQLRKLLETLLKTTISAKAPKAKAAKTDE